VLVMSCFFFQAEDGIRDRNVTGVQTCALPISTVFDKAGRGKTQWRMDANLPKGTSWLLDHIVAVPEVSHGVTRVLADVVLVDDFATARQVVNEDPRLR